MSKKEINSVIFECVDAALSSLDFTNKKVYYQYLENEFNFDFNRFGDEFETVHKALKRLYGIDHFKVEREIIRILNERTKQGSIERTREVAAFGTIVTVFMKETEENISRNKSSAILKAHAKKLESEVSEINERLKLAERMAAIGETAAMVGHDIRNPLQAIVSELYLEKQDIDTLPDGEVKTNLMQSVSTIEENLFYINKIVADLQDYSKPMKEPSEEEVDINAVIGDVLSMVPIPSNLQVIINVENGFPILKANYQMLKRALTNLVMNAVQAMPKGGNLTIQARRHSEVGEIWVADTGEGIPEDIKPKLFKPLVTSKSKGQGLGLAVVKRLVEAQRGNIWFESERGKGARFFIELPIKNSDRF